MKKIDREDRYFLAEWCEIMEFFNEPNTVYSHSYKKEILKKDDFFKKIIKFQKSLKKRLTKQESFGKLTELSETGR